MVPNNIPDIALTFLAIVVTVSAEWSGWTEWSPCSVTCGNGVVKRERTWHTEPGDVSSKPITYTDNRQCSLNYCPVNGGWTGWYPWDRCSHVCGGGQRTRKRTCTMPTPEYGGQKCQGDNFETEDCNLERCPDLPVNFDMSTCVPEDFVCESKRQCIPGIQRCDKVVHCHDGSDEGDCIKYDTLNDKNPGDGATPIYCDKMLVILGLVLLLTLLR